MANIQTFGPSSSFKPRGTVIDVTHTRGKNDTNWTLELSPFYIGPVELYGEYASWNLENAWQGCQAYQSRIGINGDIPILHLDTDGKPTNEYWKFAQKTWNRPFASRYPMGRRSVPVSVVWDGEVISRIDGRKRIYIPLYIEHVVKTSAYKSLVDMVKDNVDIALFDYDGYNLDEFKYSYVDAINDTTHPLGHSIILKSLLEGENIMELCT